MAIRAFDKGKSIILHDLKLVTLVPCLVVRLIGIELKINVYQERCFNQPAKNNATFYLPRIYGVKYTYKSWFYVLIICSIPAKTLFKASCVKIFRSPRFAAESY